MFCNYNTVRRPQLLSITNITVLQKSIIWLQLLTVYSFISYFQVKRYRVLVIIHSINANKDKSIYIIIDIVII